MTESEKVEWGLQQFVFAAKFAACCESSAIGYEVFKPSTKVNLEDGISLKIPEWDGYTQKELIKSANNYLMISLGACSIAVDEALSAIYGNSSFKLWQEKPNDLNSLREIVFLIRSAYAHKMPDVHWHIAGPRKTATYRVQTPDGMIEFDANGKHGNKLEFSHFGGLEGYVKLVFFASDLLE